MCSVHRTLRAAKSLVSSCRRWRADAVMVRFGTAALSSNARVKRQPRGVLQTKFLRLYRTANELWICEASSCHVVTPSPNSICDYTRSSASTRELLTSQDTCIRGSHAAQPVLTLKARWHRGHMRLTSQCGRMCGLGERLNRKRSSRRVSRS